MTCSMAAIVALLGFQPQPGSVVNVPSSYVERLSHSERSHAKACARRYGIRWRIVS